MESLNLTRPRTAPISPGPPAATATAAVSTEDRVLHCLARSDGLTRRELADRLDLPGATVISVAAKLVGAGLLVEHGSTQRRSTAGRNPRVLELAGYRPLLGAIVWHQGELHAWLTTYSGVVIATQTFPIEPKQVDVNTFEPALSFLREWSTRPLPTAVRAPDGQRPHRLTGVVISVPAPFQPGTGVPLARLGSYGNNRVPDRSAGPGEARTGTGSAAEHPEFAPWPRDDPMAHLADSLSVPVLIENDANLAALGEIVAGAARGHADVIYLKVGEASIGAGLVLSGALHRGAAGFAGELAHLHVDDNGPLCACGGRGCLAGQLSAGLLDAVQPAYEQSLSLADVLDMAASGEPGLARMVTDIGRVVGRRVADLTTVLNPSIIVVGGTFGPATALVASGIREQVDLYAAPVASAAVRTVSSTLGHRAEMFGAIELARTDLPPD